MSLAALRARLDLVDDELLNLLARRAGVVDEIWQWKQQHGVPRLDAAREAQLRERLAERARALGLSPEAVARVFDSIVGRQLLGP